MTGNPTSVGPELRLRVVGTGEEVAARPARLVVAGYTGRDEAAVRRHIDELAAIGIAPPPTVPMLFDLDPDLLTTDPALAVGGAQTSGEVEPVYVRIGGRWFLGVGSDHTDRVLEREDVQTSKATCPKPLGVDVVALPEQVANGEWDEEWDRSRAVSTVDGSLYQHGPLTALRPPGDLLPRVVAHVDVDRGQPDLVVFAGTLPLLDGEFRFGRQWELRLELADATLVHRYTVAPSSG